MQVNTRQHTTLKILMSSSCLMASICYLYLKSNGIHLTCWSHRIPTTAYVLSSPCYCRSPCGGTTLLPPLISFILSPWSIQQGVYHRQTLLEVLTLYPESFSFRVLGWVWWAEVEALPQVCTSLAILDVWLHVIPTPGSSFWIALLPSHHRPLCALPCSYAWATGICHTFSIGWIMTQPFKMKTQIWWEAYIVL